MFANEMVPRIERTYYGCTCILTHVQVEITPCKDVDVPFWNFGLQIFVIFMKKMQKKWLQGQASFSFWAFWVRMLNRFMLDIWTVVFPKSLSGMSKLDLCFILLQRMLQLAIYYQRNQEGSLMNGDRMAWNRPNQEMIPETAFALYKPKTKTSVTLLKEFCSKNRFSYTFHHVKEVRAFVGYISIPELEIANVGGNWKATNEEAENNACSLVLEMLKRKGIFSF